MASNQGNGMHFRIDLAGILREKWETNSKSAIAQSEKMQVSYLTRTTKGSSTLLS